MKQSSMIRTLVAMLAILVFVAGAAFAQTSNGTIAGVVMDASGAAVANAKVTATATHTGEVRATTTNSVGAYRFESLLPGVYSVEVSAPGFSTTKVDSVQVTASTITSINASLKVGKTSETVTVEAQAETLQTESGEISHNIGTAEITALPISSLNAYALATTLPGVSTTSGSVKFTNGTEFSVNGTRPRANNFLIEGQDNNDAGIKGQGLQPSNLDAVKEVVILTNSYAAEFGNGGGSVNNLIYKSGSNAFHGSGWEQHLNSFLNANDHYNNNPDRLNPKSKFRENIFGFTLGGPVKKDKVFFFVSNQWDKYRASTTGSDLYLPTIEGHNTLVALRDAATTTAAQKAQINTLLAAYGNLRGDSNAGDLSTEIALGDGRGSVKVGPIARLGIPDSSNSTEFVSKGDLLLTSKDTLSLRYVRSKGEWPYDTYNYCCQLPGFDTMQGGTSHNAGISYTRLFTNSLVNELRVSYGRIGFMFDFRPETYANPLALAPTTSISGLASWGAPSGDPQGRFHNTIQFQDSLSWNVGGHSFKFGADIADIRVRDAVPFNFYGSIGYANSNCGAAQGCATTVSYSGLANYIDGYGGASSQATINFGSPVIHPKMRAQNYFIQDAWKIRPNVTLTYGVRYEYQGTPANSLAFPAINMDDMGPANYLKRVEQQPDHNNFGPRLGIAYTPRVFTKLFGDNKTVIRAGFGMFYDGIFTNILDNTAATAPNAFAPAYTSSISAANPRGTGSWNYARIAGMQPITSPTATAQPIDAKLKNPETYQWNFDVQRELPANFTLTTGYVGTRGTHQFANTEANPLINGVRRVAGRGRIVVRDNENDSIYHALNVKLDRRFSHGFQARMAYTWSKMIDTGSEIFTGGNWSSYPVAQYPNPRGATDRGLSAYDRRHALAFTYIYQMPKWHRNGDGFLSGFANLGSILGGWQISGTTRFQSGAPGNVQAGWDMNGDGITNDRPMLGNPNAPVTSWGWEVAPGTAVVPGSTFTGYCEGTQWWYSYDDCHPVKAEDVHWIIPRVGSTSQSKAAGRNSFTLPGLQTWTFALSKEVKLTEKQSLQFRGEMFNPFNHANTGIPNLSLVSGHPWQGDIVHTCFYEPNYVGCGKPAPVQFNNLVPTESGYRDIRLMVKYVF